MQELTSIRQTTDDDINTTCQSIQIPVFKRHFGNNLTLLYIRGEPLITIGPHWPLTLCMIVTFGAASYFLIFEIAISKGLYVYYCSIFVAALQMFSYLITALKNPGIVTSSREYKGVLQCIVCNNPRDLGALYHCEDCDVCIQGFDHHCPWTGKCIGRGNINAFYIFVTMIPIYIVYFIIVSLL
ncbi:unnamed protein product (macronuclear) [Paramecium tetraurelia]|uniref:Palmitoyltransferase n=1 Tax=Paramecium tetraurelia TaxID=5888 RepID=A0CZZ5_PARTE|nr:uncharacterized protein GSPATT00011936001 [Paramecium tetraurelia]CAK76362.1 unnamed protein product [Paramecium tetraurelia]|eukprot:XP_001443759.1 hypothetical protein (macronuclear) [Paramecium tetraurelia strain d4-2]